MGSWYYLWENGDVSFVSAPSKETAAAILDEVGEAEVNRLKPVPILHMGGDGFFLTFTPSKEVDPEKFGWEQDEHSEGVLRVLSDVEKEARKRQKEE